MRNAQLFVMLRTFGTPIVHRMACLASRPFPSSADRSLELRQIKEFHGLNHGVASNALNCLSNTIWRQKQPPRQGIDKGSVILSINKNTSQ